LLLQLWDAEARAALAQAKAAVDQAAARVDQLRKVGAIVANETTRQAETNYQRAAAELARTEQLSTTGAVSQSELDDARRRLEIARAQRSAAEVQQIALAPLGADSRVALSALLQSQAQFTAASVRLEQTRLVARQAGVILTRNVQPGDVVQPAQALLVLAADADTELVIAPDERNLAWISLGQKARVSADAYPELVFDAEVNYIAPSVDARRGSVEVRLSVPDPPDILKPDMTVSVDLTVATKARVLTLSAEAVRGAATREPWVLVAAGGRAKKQRVQLGIRGDDRVEITSGLDEHSVVLSSDPPISNGDRVRPVVGAR
jgi:HlyD family secretion protein